VARHGDRRAPVFIGGGKAHGARRREFDISLNKKVRALGLKMALSSKAKAGLVVVDNLDTDGKTKALAAKFKAMNLDSVLVIADEVDENLYLASRNLVNVLVVEPRYADPLSLVHYRKVLVTKAAMDKLKEMFA